MNKEMPKRIWVSPTIYTAKLLDDDIEYVRADRYDALLNAVVSLHHWLYEITDTMLNQPDTGEREIADMLDDAQLAIDKYNRFLDDD